MAESTCSKPNKRKAITLAEKVEIINKLQCGAANARICREHSLSKSTVSTIWANKDKYLNGQHVVSTSTKKMRTSSNPALDQSLLKWFSLKRTQNVAISGPILQTKASELGNIIKRSAQNEESVTCSNYVCNKSWIDRFKRRHEIKSGKIHGESAAVSPEVTTQWLAHVWPNLRQNYSESNIFNADETGLFFKMTPNNTLRFKGEKCAGGKLSKERITVLVCANMDGSEKRDLIVVGKTASPRCFKNVSALPVTYFSNKRAWITSDIFTKILCGWDAELMKQKRKILLLVDNCSAHPKIDTLKCIELVFFPPNVTSVLQPMDQGVIRSLKSHYRKQVVVKIITAIDEGEAEKITLLDAIMMLSAAWRKVTKSTIAHCFRHAGLRINNNEFEEEDELPLAEWIRKERERDIEESDNLPEWAKNNGLTQFQSCDLQEFVNVDDNLTVAEFPDETEIVSTTITHHQETEEIENHAEEEAEPHGIPTAQEALDALKTVNVFVNCVNFDIKSVEAVDYLQNKIEKRVLGIKKIQTKITDFI